MLRNLLVIPAAVLCVTLPAQDPAAKKEVESFVKDALAFAKANPKEAFIGEVCRPNGKFSLKGTGRLYLTVYDDKGKVVAHGKKVAEVGSVQWDAKDQDGVLYIQDRIKLARTKGGGWVEDTKVNPATMQKSIKHVFVAYHDGMTVCCGVYEK